MKCKQLIRWWFSFHSPIRDCFLLHNQMNPEISFSTWKPFFGSDSLLCRILGKGGRRHGNCKSKSFLFPFFLTSILMPFSVRFGKFILWWHISDCCLHKIAWSLMVIYATNTHIVMLWRESNLYWLFWPFFWSQETSEGLRVVLRIENGPPPNIPGTQFICDFILTPVSTHINIVMLWS